MIDLNDACDRVSAQVFRNEPVERALELTLDCVLAETIVAPHDSPPYDKSMVDGYAIRAADWSAGATRWAVVEEILAGQVPHQLLGPGQASRIMTGAPLPSQADAVVAIEQTRNGGGAAPWVEITASSVSHGQNVMRRGTALRKGDVMLPAGQRIRPIEIGLLAEMGCAHVQVVRPPRVALIQTGDELVAINQSLGPGQIRNSNGSLLRALVERAGCVAEDHGIVRDDPDLLLAAVHQGLSTDVLVLSGGVSAGDRDLVPDVLIRAGVKCVFHKVQLRPGKPLWFGVRRGAARPTLVFGLPGNPVSGLVCFRLFVLPTLRALAGHSAQWTWQRKFVELSTSFVLRGARPTFWPGRTDVDSGRVEPLAWLGSADPFTLARSDCLIFFAQGDHTYSAGESVPVVDLDG